jgi:hypothetical protein
MNMLSRSPLAHAGDTQHGLMHSMGRRWLIASLVVLASAALLAILIASLLAFGVFTRTPTSLTLATNVNGSTHLARAYSSTSSISVLALSDTIDLNNSLPPPTGLTAKAGNAQVTLTWHAVKEATGYWIYLRNVTAGQATYTKEPFPVTGTSSTVKPLTNEDMYCFYVSAFNAHGGSGPSNIACATPS